MDAFLLVSQDVSQNLASRYAILKRKLCCSIEHPQKFTEQKIERYRDEQSDQRPIDRKA